MNNLTAPDLAMFARFGITPDLIAQAGIERVVDGEARERYDIVGYGDRNGIVFPYFDPASGRRLTARLRRDRPEIEEGKPKNKYVSAYGDRRHLYFVPGCKELVRDSTVPIVLVEAEKSALAITAWGDRMSRKVLPIAMGGCWGSRGRIGIAETSKGERVDEVGPLPDLAVCSNRDVVVMLDSNAADKPEVRAASSALVRELGQIEARVRIATIPASDGINGPDDLIAIRGDGGIQHVLEHARPAAELALAEAEAAIEKIVATKPKITAEEMRQALDAVADVSDPIQRAMLETRFANAVRGVIAKKMLVREVAERRQERDARQQEFSRENREAELRAVPVDATRLIEELAIFFADRACLPQGAALVLAYWAMNTWTFKVFDTVPYLLLESTVPGCGKSTVIRLLAAISCCSRKASSLSEAVMFRLIDAETPTLLVDEAETVDGRSERAEALRAIAHEGYKEGGQVPRCEGEDHDVRWFDVYCPKAFAAIGGLTGALLDRCLVIHMEKAPKGSVRKSTRHRALDRDRRHLVEQLESYALQYSDALRRLYEAEPDCGYWASITDREAELWGPLLIHARLAGPDAEARLLAVVDKFSEEKAEIKSSDSRIAQALALLDAISRHPGTTFTPGDLVPILAQSEAWGRMLAEAKGRDDDSVRVNQAARIGYFLRSFRLHGKKNGAGHVAYEREAAIACLSAHVPQNPPYSPQPPVQSHREMQVAEDKVSLEGTEATEGFGFSTAEADKVTRDPSVGYGVNYLSNVARTAAVVLTGDENTNTTSGDFVEEEI